MEGRVPLAVKVDADFRQLIDETAARMGMPLHRLVSSMLQWGFYHEWRRQQELLRSYKAIEPKSPEDERWFRLKAAEANKIIQDLQPLAEYHAKKFRETVGLDIEEVI